MSCRNLVLYSLQVVCLLLATPACAATADLVITSNDLSVAAGGTGSGHAYSHSAVAGVTQDLGNGWSLRGSVGWTAGRSLSARAIGDVAGVQGTYNGGDGLWLYESSLRYDSDDRSLAVGRLSASDAFGAVEGMSRFVNAAFSSSGGAISLNDPGRATSPAASWGMSGRRRYGAVEISAGAFLSSPRQFALSRHGVDFSFHPREGVLGFVQADLRTGQNAHVGFGAYNDTARFQTFDGREVRGDGGMYVYSVSHAELWGRPVQAFAMAQAAPKRDRNLEPLFLIGGLTLSSPWPERPDDTVSLGVSHGVFSHRSGLSAAETAFEMNYGAQISPRWVLRPDLQYILNPGGGRDALVVGAQIELQLQSGDRL